MEDVKPVTETSDKLDLKSEIQLLKLAKEALDLQLISHLEERSKTCSQDLQHLMVCTCLCGVVIEFFILLSGKPSKQAQREHPAVC